MYQRENFPSANMGLNRLPQIWLPESQSFWEFTYYVALLLQRKTTPHYAPFARAITIITHSYSLLNQTRPYHFACDAFHKQRYFLRSLQRSHIVLLPSCFQTLKKPPASDPCSQLACMSYFDWQEYNCTGRSWPLIAMPHFVGLYNQITGSIQTASTLQTILKWTDSTSSTKQQTFISWLNLMQHLLPTEIFKLS